MSYSLSFVPISLEEVSKTMNRCTKTILRWVAKGDFPPPKESRRKTSF